MTEPPDQSDNDAITTEDIEDTTTDAPDTDMDTDALETDMDAADTNAPTDEGEVTEPDDKSVTGTAKRDEGSTKDVQVKRKRKKIVGRSVQEKCMEERWTCDDMPLWRVYMKLHLEDKEKLEKEDIFKHRRPANLAKFPRVASDEDVSTPYKCLPLNAFQLKDQLRLPNKLKRQELIRIWKNMRGNLPVHESKSAIAIKSGASKTDSEQWPGMWPCTKRDLINEIQERRRKERQKRRDIFPCDREEEPLFDEPEKDYADRKELGHARIPQICPEPTKDLLVDRAAGEQPGLVDGDYIIFELPSRSRGTRVYADVCLRGLKGMHLPELGVLRARRKTWKFCFYQSVVALLAKTQLRYKYAWSANIDYIYDHAWMLFAHIGMINVKEKQRLDDVVVYNYKYSVEVELIQELNDVLIVTDIPADYEERNLKRKAILERKELMNIKLEIGSEKITDEQKAPVHRALKRVEDWFDKLSVRYRNCIFRTTRFSLAFWKDNLFWYLYNPYRCDEFGYWDDSGCACILKFCTKQSLKRHLMILLLRAYVYSLPKSGMEKSKKETTDAAAEGAEEGETPEITDDTKKEESPEITDDAKKEESPEITDDAKTEESPEITDDTKKEETLDITDDAQDQEDEESTEEKYYTLQIYQVIHHCCQIHNLKLLQRGAPKPPRQLVKRKTIDDCPFDPLDLRDPCTIEQEESDLKDAIEKPTWLKLYKVTWAKCLPGAPKKKSAKEIAGGGKMRWHQYLVEESNKLFSLWGEIHITDGMFERENRGMQTYACYVVCAGMSRIMAPEYWTSKTLDVIVMCGDRYYAHSKLEAEFKSTKNEYGHVSCWNRYLMSHFKIGETMFETNVLPAICGRLYAKSAKYLWLALEQMFLKYHFGILTCESSCLGIFKFCGGYYMCDVNSFGPPLFQYGEGAAYLLRATYFYKFIVALVLTIGSPECSQFALNPIEILKVVDVGPVGFPGARVEKKERGKRLVKVECPYDEEKKKQMKRWKHRRAETARTIDKTCCKGTD